MKQESKMNCLIGLVVLFIALVSGNNAFITFPIGNELPATQIYGFSSQFGKENGSVADIEDHPYQAAIFHEENFVGSGAILNKNWIISIALPPLIKEKGRIKVGAEKTSEIHSFNEIEKLVYHPKFTLGTNYNFALIKLKKPLTFSENVSKVSIASSSPVSGVEVVTSGYGIFDPEGTYPSSPILRETSFYIVTQEDCAPSFSASIVSKTSICAYKDEEVGLNFYDSGNPLVEDDKLIGLFQGMFQDFLCYTFPCPYVYSDLTLVKSWIEETITNA